MHLITGFYGGVLLIGIICCGLLLMLAPTVASAVAKRLMISLLLFITSIMLRPDATSGLLAGGLRLLLSFVLFASSIVYLLVPSAMKNVLLFAAALVIASLLIWLALAPLWPTSSGRIILFSSLAAVYMGWRALRKN